MNLQLLPWKEIGKYGFATVAAVFLGVYYRVDAVLPQRQLINKLVEVTERQAKTEAEQTLILRAIRDDQRKFPAVAEARND
jgi:hypothetical protein